MTKWKKYRNIKQPWLSLTQVFAALLRDVPDSRKLLLSCYLKVEKCLFFFFFIFVSAWLRFFQKPERDIYIFKIVGLCMLFSQELYGFIDDVPIFDGLWKRNP